MRTFLFILCTLIFNRCSLKGNEDKLKCYNNDLAELSKTTLYKNIVKEAHLKLPLLRDKDNRSFLYDSTYIDSAQLDKAVFLNKKKDKCLLLIMQQTSTDLKLDQVQVVQGTLIRERWQFSFDRLPAVPNTTLTVRKKGEYHNLSNPFSELENRGRTFVLTAGIVASRGCEIDNKYWFGD